MAIRIKKNDTVEVIAGAHRGARGKVLHVDQGTCRVVVEGVNLVYRHVRPSRRNPQGGRIHKEAAIHLSNVMAVDPVSGKPKRVSFRVKRDGQGRVLEKTRVVRGTQTVLHALRRTELPGN